MQIHSKFLGEVEVEEKDVITFTEGLLGLEDYKKYVLLPIDAETPFAFLQSTEEKEIGFVVAYPFSFKNDYTFDLSDDDKDQLKIEKVEDVISYSIVTLKETFHDSTINLLAPIIINMKRKIGKQIVLQDQNVYPLRYPIAAKEGSAK